MLNKKPFLDSLGIMVIEVDESSSLKEIYEHVSKDRRVLYKYLLKRISYGIENSFTSVRIFRIYGSDYYLDCKRGDWKKYLNRILDYFVELEEYEICDKAAKLIKKINKKKHGTRSSEV